MTKFVMTNFEGDEFVTYEGKFVARFKRGGRHDFLVFLVKNFSVEEYFDLLEKMPPVRVLGTKGYILPVVKKTLKRFGYAPTAEGYRSYVKDVMRSKA